MMTDGQINIQYIKPILHNQTRPQIYIFITSLIVYVSLRLIYNILKQSLIRTPIYIYIYIPFIEMFYRKLARKSIILIQFQWYKRTTSSIRLAKIYVQYQMYLFELSQRIEKRATAMSISGQCSSERKRKLILYYATKKTNQKLQQNEYLPTENGSDNMCPGRVGIS